MLIGTIYGAETIVELSGKIPRKANLGTEGYIETEKEGIYSKLVNEDQINVDVAVDMPPPEGVSKLDWEKQRKDEGKDDKRIKSENFTLESQNGKYVSWFGIVRESKGNELLLEHKYFDGLTDLHLQIISINGAGDFNALTSGKSIEIPRLSLVRIYGKLNVKNNKIIVDAEYLRIWPQGQFAFMDYGFDKSNENWKALRKIKNDDIYSSRPNENYYFLVLGK